MMEAADHGRLDDPALLEARNQSWLRRVLVQREVCSGAVIVDEVLAQQATQMLERAVHRQTERDLGLVAEIDAPDGIDIVAGERYYVHADNRRCEFAITVADAWQGVGLASRLMRELIEAARVRGLKQMESFVLAGNSRMLALARRLGFTVTTDPNDMTVKIVRLDLTNAGN
jgi:L-amino acid N-acyltransferase YncA